jgi:phosphomannomutase
MDEMSPPSTSTYVDIDEGKKEYRDVSDAWIEHILDFAGRDIDWSTYTIVADGGSGCAGAFMGKLALRAGFTYIPLYMAPDGDFPYHHPNPMLAENRADARDMLLQKNADIAFIFDGDADRVVVLDDHGDMVTSGVLSSIIAQGLSTRYPQASYIGNATISHVFADTVHTLGSIYEREMVGHVYIREHMMRDPSIVYAGEHSAHYFFRDNYYMDSGIVAGMVFLAAVARSSQKVSTMTSTYSREYITLEEKNFTVADSKACIQKLLSIYQKEDHDMLDGLTVRYTDGSWYNVRASSNEPLLRLNLEAKTQSRYDELYAEVMGYIG